MKTTLLLFLLLAGVACAESKVPADFDEMFGRLAGLVDREEVGVMDMARGSYDGARFIGVGAPGVERLDSRFLDAGSFGEAAVAGLYMTVWGKAEHLAKIRRELETNPLKRKWLSGLVGSEELFFGSMSGGAAYQPLLRLLPTVGGTRSLAMLCIGSKDPLVRRAGLFWGFWLADDSYWKAVRMLAKNENDRTTLKVVQRLLLRPEAK
ncbi:MAG: hypothetical protein M9963_07740 [Kiritimatiellae bacterium]|nr:hypothetical protein [Kiritimatiellia bacterium]MCO5069532.1 hypothetical protein [Kiritimatiellia bacterium]